MLVHFNPIHAGEVLAWPQSEQELSFWASLDKQPDASVFSDWHADEDVSGFVLLEEGGLLAYGEIWREPGERSVELARILVSPARRRSGVGSRLVSLLIEHAGVAELDAFWVRVVPENQAALGCYASLGFVPASASEQRQLNAGQPREYVWLSRSARLVV